MKQTRIFLVNTRQTFAGSTLWTEGLLKKELGDSKWEVFWTNYSDEHPKLADVNRPEGELTADELFSLIDRFNSNVGVLRLHKKADDSSMFAFDTDYWISPTILYGTKVI